MFSELSRILRERKRPVAFLAGAGISMDPPTGLPNGWQVMHECLESMLPHTSREELINHAFARREDRKYRPGEFMRFESLMAVWNRIDPTLHVLAPMDTCTNPNTNHFLLARFIHEGNVVMTTNFDRLIEVAFQILYPHQSLRVACYDNDFDFGDIAAAVSTPTLWKLHGSLSVDGRSTLDSLQATFTSMMSAELTAKKQSFLEEVLDALDVVVAGYSGLDDLDLVPVFAKVTTDALLLWIKHDRNQWPPLMKGPRELMDYGDVTPYDLTGLYRIMFSAGAKNRATRTNGHTKIIIGHTTRVLCDLCGVPLPSDLSTPGDLQRMTLPFRTMAKNLHEAAKLRLAFDLFETGCQARSEDRLLLTVLRNLWDNLKPTDISASESLHYYTRVYNHLASGPQVHDKNLGSLRALFQGLEALNFNAFNASQRLHLSRLKAHLMEALGDIPSAVRQFGRIVVQARAIRDEVEELHALESWNAALRRMGQVLPPEEFTRLGELYLSTGFLPQYMHGRIGEITRDLNNFRAAVNVGMTVRVDPAVESEVHWIRRYCVDIGDIEAEAQTWILIGEMAGFQDRREDELWSGLKVAEIATEVDKNYLKNRAASMIRRSSHSVTESKLEEYRTRVETTTWAQMRHLQKNPA